MVLRKSIGVLLLGIAGLSCATSHKKPCSEGGQPPREVATTVPFRGIKRCYQTRDATGQFLNDGKYYEWFPNDHIALVGEYKMGKKDGRWIEYDEKGKKKSDKYFSDGKEVPAP